MDNKINWADFPIFLAVIEEGSLSGAARKLHLSQPTIGRRMSALEEQIGVPLLHKTSAGLAATAMGVKVLEHVRQMDHQAEAITRTTAAEEQTLAGEITISATPGIGDMWLPWALIELYEAHPEIRIIIDVNFEQANLARREADIALRWFGPGNQNSLIGRKIVSTGFGLYAAAKYLDQSSRPQTEADLANHLAVSVEVGGNSPVWPKNLSEISTQPRRISFQSNSFHTQSMAIAGGYGIGTLPHIMARQNLGVERVLPDYELFQDLWIVAHDDLSRNKRIRLVFDFLIMAMNRDQEHFATGKLHPWMAVA